MSPPSSTTLLSSAQIPKPISNPIDNPEIPTKVIQSSVPTEALPLLAEEAPKNIGITGLVQMKDRQLPISGVEVELIAEVDLRGFEVVDVCSTASDGTFEFPDVDPASKFELKLGWPYRYKQAPYRQPSSTSNPSVFYLLEATEQGAVTGYVYFPDGSPVHGAWIQREYSLGNVVRGITQTDKDGRFGFPHDGGSWRILAKGSMGALTDPIDFALVQGDIIEQDFILPHCANIYMSITKPDGKPPWNNFSLDVKVIYSKLWDNGEPRSLTSTSGGKKLRFEGGNFILPNLEVGEYKLTLYASDFEPTVIEPIIIDESLEDQYVSITLIPKKKEPISTRPKSKNTPEAQIKVSLDFSVQDEHLHPLNKVGTFLYIVKEEDLAFLKNPVIFDLRSVDLPLGSYWLVAIKEGYTADIQYVNITEQSNDIMFTLGKSGTVYGSIAQQSAKHVVVLPLELWRLFGEPSRVKRYSSSLLHKISTALAQGTKTNENGDFTLHYLPTGWYVVLTDNSASEPTEVRDGHETGPIQLP